MITKKIALGIITVVVVVFIIGGLFCNGIFTL